MKHLLPADLVEAVAAEQRQWLVTGAAGFIGSNLVEALLSLDQIVIGLDNFSTGHRRNLEEVQAAVGKIAWSNFEMIEGDIRERATCREVVKSGTIVLHQAALGSVPRSIADPLTSHDVNVTGFVNMLEAARLKAARRFVYAASSSTYGDEPNLPKREERIGSPLSPYAATKLADEIYAAVYARSYDFRATGLRYFNVFGPRQDPEGPYAAVIPKWAAAMISGQDIVINGNGSTSRDFCFVANAVQANLRAALAPQNAQGQVYNVAVGGRTSLNELFAQLKTGLSSFGYAYGKSPRYDPFRPGDVLHSEADVSKANQFIGYVPSHDIGAGLSAALPWYVQRYRVRS